MQNSNLCCGRTKGLIELQADFSSADSVTKYCCDCDKQCRESTPVCEMFHFPPLQRQPSVFDEAHGAARA